MIVEDRRESLFTESASNFVLSVREEPRTADERERDRGRERKNFQALEREYCLPELEEGEPSHYRSELRSEKLSDESTDPFFIQTATVDLDRGFRIHRAQTRPSKWALVLS